MFKIGTENVQMSLQKYANAAIYQNLRIEIIHISGATFAFGFISREGQVPLLPFQSSRYARFAFQSNYGPTFRRPERQPAVKFFLCYGRNSKRLECGGFCKNGLPDTWKGFFW